MLSVVKTDMKKKRQIFMMIVFLTFFTVGSLYGCRACRNQEAKWPYEEGSPVDIELLEKTYQSLGELFNQARDELQHFIDCLMEDEDLLHAFENNDIIFFRGQTPSIVLDQNTLAVYDGGIRTNIELSVLRELVTNSARTNDALRQIHEQNIINHIRFREFQYADAWISFEVSVAHTRSMLGDGWRGHEFFFFRYIDSDYDMEQARFGNRRIGEGWYMYISPPPG